MSPCLRRRALQALQDALGYARLAIWLLGFANRPPATLRAMEEALARALDEERDLGAPQADPDKSSGSCSGSEGTQGHPGP